MKARSLLLGYDATEDRLTLELTVGEGQRVLLCLTRRLTAMWINGMAGLLERSSPKLRVAPNEMKDDLILMEHHSALQASATGTTREKMPPAVKRAQNVPTRLVSAIRRKTTPNSFELSIEADSNAAAALSLKRIQLHRLLEELTRIAREANWNIAMDAAWMKPGHTDVVFN